MVESLKYSLEVFFVSGRFTKRKARGISAELLGGFKQESKEEFPQTSRMIC